jgi:outer membrane protein assembly factor BamB
MSSIANIQEATASKQRRLRLWPGVALIVIQWLVVLIVGTFFPPGRAQFYAKFMMPIIGAVLLCVWWLFASRLRWTDRLLVFSVFLGMGVITKFVGGAGFPTMAVLMYALPAVTTIWVGYLLFTYYLPWPGRRAGLLAVMLLTWGYFMLLRLDGIDGDMAATMQWRWTPTAEEKFLAQSRQASAKTSTVPAESAAKELKLEPGDWPEFRGPARDGQRSNLEIATDWNDHPPRELWRHRVGPGWSSFAVVGTRIYTQEQRGEDEVVVCYDSNTGEELWNHFDATRFTEVVAGPGPRATPTFYQGNIYALGASGKLNCLDAMTGKLRWTRDVAADSGAKVPQWGFSASPLVAEGIVTVFAGGPKGKSVLGYKIADGDLAWSAGEGQISYCSTQLTRIDGVEQILLTTNMGLVAFRPATGEILWEHRWPQEDLARIVQPALVDKSDILIGTGMGIGTRRVRLKHDGDTWTTEEVWTSRAFKPYFNDLVVQDGYLYGFDGNVFMCVNLADGKPKWRARGYGSGQVLLLADQKLLLVLSEQGEVVLVKADPDKHQEVAKFKALEGKTWNHPVIAHGKLFVRNGEEAACFELTETHALAARKN